MFLNVLIRLTVLICLERENPMNGAEVCRLMRANNVTIRALAARMDITLKRIRNVRENGLENDHFVRDWVEAITGKGVDLCPFVRYNILNEGAKRMTTTYKSIAFAYPSSINAKRLRMADTGCYFVQQRLANVDGDGQHRATLAHNCEGFDTADHPDLIALFHEYDGQPCPYFLRYGNIDALRALGLAVAS